MAGPAGFVAPLFVIPLFYAAFSDALNSKKKSRDDEEKKKMKTYTFKATDGRRFIPRLLKNHSTEDVKQALRAAGAKDLAKQIAYSGSDKRKERMQKLTKKIVETAKSILSTPKGKSEE